MSSDSDTVISELKSKVKEFIHVRAWEKYHNPKNIAESISIESAELLQIFQWITPSEALSWKRNPTKIKPISEEMADVLIYCFSLANVLNIDITEAVMKKIKTNEIKYPVKKFFGKWQND